MDQEEFLIQHLTEGKSYKEIASEHNIQRKQLTEWWDTGFELRSQIKRSNQLYNSKKNKEEFAGFKNITQRGFFEWFRNHTRTCFYCEVEEYKLKELFDAGMLKTKRGRGRSLELERRDATSNLYSKENCVLACYFCNNHKSDIISEEDHLEHFSANIRRYLEDKYQQLKNDDNR